MLATGEDPATKILIGYDGSSCTADTIADLERAGLPGRIEALVMSAADVYLPTASDSAETAATPELADLVRGARERASAALGTAQRLAEEGRDLVRTRFPDWRVDAFACADSPAWALVKKARDWKADLVAVGSRGHSALSRFVLGSVSQKVLNEAPCSVRIGRPAADPSGAPRVLVGIDGSRRAQEAVRRVAAGSWPAGTEVRVATVLDLRVATQLARLDRDQAPWLGPQDQDPTKWVHRMLDASCESLRRSGLTVSSSLLEGESKRGLLEEAERFRADCIFVGSTGLGAVERFLLGTVASAVAARAACSVEVVRPAIAR